MENQELNKKQEPKQDVPTKNKGKKDDFARTARNYMIKEGLNKLHIIIDNHPVWKKLHHTQKSTLANRVQDGRRLPMLLRKLHKQEIITENLVESEIKLYVERLYKQLYKEELTKLQAVIPLEEQEIIFQLTEGDEKNEQICEFWGSESTEQVAALSKKLQTYRESIKKTVLEYASIEAAMMVYTKQMEKIILDEFQRYIYFHRTLTEMNLICDESTVQDFIDNYNEIVAYMEHTKDDYINFIEYLYCGGELKKTIAQLKVEQQENIKKKNHKLQEQKQLLKEQVEMKKQEQRNKIYENILLEQQALYAEQGFDLTLEEVDKKYQENLNKLKEKSKSTSTLANDKKEINENKGSNSNSKTNKPTTKDSKELTKKNSDTNSPTDKVDFILPTVNTVPTENEEEQTLRDDFSLLTNEQTVTEKVDMLSLHDSETEEIVDISDMLKECEAKAKVTLKSKSQKENTEEKVATEISTDALDKIKENTTSVFTSLSEKLTTEDVPTSKIQQEEITQIELGELFSEVSTRLTTEDVPTPKSQQEEITKVEIGELFSVVTNPNELENVTVDESSSNKKEESTATDKQRKNVTFIEKVITKNNVEKETTEKKVSNEKVDNKEAKPNSNSKNNSKTTSTKQDKKAKETVTKPIELTKEDLQKKAKEEKELQETKEKLTAAFNKIYSKIAERGGYSALEKFAYQELVRYVTLNHKLTLTYTNEEMLFVQFTVENDRYIVSPYYMMSDTPFKLYSTKNFLREFLVLDKGSVSVKTERQIKDELIHIITSYINANTVLDNLYNSRNKQTHFTERSDRLKYLATKQQKELEKNKINVFHENNRIFIEIVGDKNTFGYAVTNGSIVDITSNTVIYNEASNRLSELPISLPKFKYSMNTTQYNLIKELIIKSYDLNSVL